jgi:hypothetical protein
MASQSVRLDGASNHLDEVVFIADFGCFVGIDRVAVLRCYCFITRHSGLE